MSESKIRDKLISNLSIFDMGLELVGKEYFVPNSEGTRGFIDILAKDNYGRYVIIELKRSNSSARQAIHEVLKYIEGLKENKSLRDDEIISLIVSTEWDELIIPFSSHVKNCKSETVGFKLCVDKSLNPVSALKVSPIEIQNERIFSHSHMCYFYYDEHGMAEGLKSISNSYLAKGIKDYLLVVLRYDSKSLDKNKIGFREYDNGSGNYLKPLRLLVYTTSQLLSDTKYLEIINSNKDDFEEFDEDYIFSLKDLEKTEELYHSVLNRLPFPKKDYVEIGYPAKFAYDILECGWEILYLKKFGRVMNNKLLTDNVIINELKGLSGNDFCNYKKSFISLEHLKKSAEEMEHCLKYNDVWRIGVISAIRDVCKKLNGKVCNSVDSYIFNPSNTIYTMNLIVKSAMNFESTDQWIPRYFIDIDTDDYSYKYYGCLIETDLSIDDITFKKVIEECYNGNVTKLIMSQSHGGFESNDCEFVMNYGLKYANYLIVINKKEESKEAFYYSGFRYEKFDAPHPYSGIYNFIRTKSEFCRDICELYDRHDIGSGLFIY